MSLEKLESKVEDRRIIKNKVEDAEVDNNRDIQKLLASVDAVYRLVDNTTRRIERNLQNVERKQNTIIKAIENSGVDLEELQKQEEIKRLENKLKELKRGN